MLLGSKAKDFFADRYCIFESIDSTTSWLVSNKPKQPTICLAHRQTHGYGRRDKIWLTPQGNLALSCCFSSDYCPHPELGYSLVVALALHELMVLYGIDARTKWPNDLLVGNQKLAGILIQLDNWNTRNQIIIGIGINNRWAPCEQTTCIFNETNRHINSEQLGADIIELLVDYTRRYASAGFVAFKQQWLASDIWFGRQIRVQYDRHIIEGKHAGVDQHGQLLVAQNNHTLTYNAGEVSIRENHVR